MRGTCGCAGSPWKTRRDYNSLDRVADPIMTTAAPLVLVVEGDQGVRLPLEKFLELHKFRVVSAETSDAGISAIQRYRPRRQSSTFVWSVIGKGRGHRDARERAGDYFFRSAGGIRRARASAPVYTSRAQALIRSRCSPRHCARCWTTRRWHRVLVEFCVSCPATG